MGNLIKFRKETNEANAIILLEIGQELAHKMKRFGDYLGTEYPEFIDDEIYQIEQLALTLLEFDSENETIFELLESFVLKEITVKEFIKRGKQVNQLIGKKGLEQ